MAIHMVELAKAQPGYLGMESVRGVDGKGITISYWKSMEDIASWKENQEHKSAQESGKGRWYSSYEVKICRVEGEYAFAQS